MTTKLTTEELEGLRSMQAQFTKLKISLGDIELTKQDILKEIADIREFFDEQEKQLIAKYGADAVINVQTGEVKQKATA